MKSRIKIVVAVVALSGLLCHGMGTAVALVPEDKSNQAIFRGMELEKKGDKKGAIAAYTEALRIDPKNSNGYRSRAKVKFDLRNFPGALEDFDAALFLTPTDTFSLLYRAKTKKQLHNNVGALRDCDQAVAIDPVDPSVRVMRAEVFAERDNKEEMKSLIDDCNYAIGKNFDVGVCYSLRGDAKRVLGDTKGAFADAKLAYNAGNKSPHTFGVIAFGNAELGNYTEALKAIAEGEKIQPDVALFYFSAEIFEKRGMLQEAINLYERATKLNPRAWYAWFNLGNCLCGQGSMIRGEAAYRKALELNPDNVAVQLAVADALRQQKKWDEAKAMLEKVNELAPHVADENLALVEAKRFEDFPAFSGQYETTYDFDGHDVPATMEVDYVDRGVYAVTWKCLSGEKILGTGMRGCTSVMAMAYLSQAKNLGVVITRWSKGNRFELLSGTNKKLKGHVVKRWLTSQDKTKTPSGDPPAESFEPDIVGTYSVDGQWKTKYQGTLTIAKDGEAYSAKWKLNDGREFSGPAILSGQFFASAFELNGFPCVMIYTIGANATLRGTWASPGFKQAGIENALKKQ